MGPWVHCEMHQLYMEGGQLPRLRQTRKGGLVAAAHQQISKCRWNCPGRQLLCRQVRGSAHHAPSTTCERTHTRLPLTSLHLPFCCRHDHAGGVRCGVPAAGACSFRAQGKCMVGCQRWGPLGVGLSALHWGALFEALLQGCCCPAAAHLLTGCCQGPWPNTVLLALSDVRLD